MQPAFEPLALLALPLGVIARAQEDYVLARHVSRAARRSEHLAFHASFYLAGDGDEKIIPLGARPRLALLVEVLLTVDPLPKTLKPSWHHNPRGLWFKVPGSARECEHNSEP